MNPRDAKHVVDHLLAARSVAVIGASSREFSAAGRTLRYLKMYGYAGEIYPVNPDRDEVQGLLCYPSLESLPAVPELAVIVRPAPAVPEAVEECGRAGIPSAIVFASGFAEIGRDGARLQQRVADMARRTGIRVLGPNCNGVIGVPAKLTATFMSGIDEDGLTLRDDGVAFVTQSGAMGAFILYQAQAAGLGVGRFVSTGNEMDVTFGEIVAGLVQDPTVRVVLGYVEGVRDPEKLREALARAAERGVPVCLMKVGRGSVGAAAAASHTGALAGEDVVFDGLLTQYGVTRARDIDHLLDLGRAFAFTPRPRGRRISIVTLSGGAAVLMADAAEDYGLDVPRWEDEWAERLRLALPPFAAVRNPIDLTGALVTDTSLLRSALAVACEHPGTDIVMVLLGNMQKQERAACDIIAEAAAGTDKPIVTVWVGGTGEAVARLAARGLPAFTEPVRAVRAVAALVEHACPAPPRSRSTVRKGEASGARTGRLLDEVAAKELLRRYRVPTVAERAVTTAQEAAEAARAIGFPVVVKILSTQVAHKSDHGLVAVGLADEQAVLRAAAQILEQALGIDDRRLVVQRMVPSETELILGMRRDPTFGPVIALGIGGVLTEVAADVQVRLPPLRPADVHSMLDRLRYAALLSGVRGRVPADRDAVCAAVLGFSEFIMAEGDRFESVEVNPLLIDQNGLPIAVDALAIERF